MELYSDIFNLFSEPFIGDDTGLLSSLFSRHSIVYRAKYENGNKEAIPRRMKKIEWNALLAVLGISFQWKC